MKPVTGVVDILRDLLTQALAGEIRAIFVLSRWADGEYGTDDFAVDHDDLTFELAGEVIRRRGG